MNIIKKKVERWSFGKDWRTVIATFQNLGGTSGRLELYVHDFQFHWSHEWYSMGTSNIISFLKECSTAYIVDKLMYGHKDEEVDVDELIGLAEEQDLHYDSEAPDGYDHDTLHKMFGEDYFYDVPMKKTRDLEFCEKAVAELKLALEHTESEA